MERMKQPRFHVLDIVEIGDHPTLAKDGLVGLRGAVTQVRRYPGGRFQYGLGDVDHGVEVGGLYDEENLLPTGQRATIDLFRLPGPFRVRDVVTISDTCDQAEIAGKTGVVEYCDWSDDGESGPAIWVEELQLVFQVEPRFLSPTGERLSPPPLGRTATSTRVDVSGHVLGQVKYVIEDEIEHYL
jgi:hypothetical protein